MNLSLKAMRYVVDQGGDPRLVTHNTVVFVFDGVSTSVAFWAVPGIAAPTLEQLEVLVDWDPVPFSVSKMQLRLSLLEDGHTPDAVSALIDVAITDPIENAKAHVAWNDATEYQRSHPLVISLAPALGYDTGEKIDTVFRRAAAYV